MTKIVLLTSILLSNVAYSQHIGQKIIVKCDGSELQNDADSTNGKIATFSLNTSFFVKSLITEKRFALEADEKDDALQQFLVDQLDIDEDRTAHIEYILFMDNQRPLILLAERRGEDLYPFGWLYQRCDTCTNPSQINSIHTEVDGPVARVSNCKLLKRFKKKGFYLSSADAPPVKPL